MKTTLEIIGKGVIETLKFFGTLIGIVVSIIFMLFLSVEGSILLEVDNYRNDAIDQWCYKFTGNNLFFIHSLGTGLIIIACLIFMFLIYKCIKNMN